MILYLYVVGQHSEAPGFAGGAATINSPRLSLADPYIVPARLYWRDCFEETIHAADTSEYPCPLRHRKGACGTP